MSLLFGPNLDQLLYCPGATLGPAVTMAGWFHPLSAGEGVGTVQARGGTLIWHESSGTDARPRLGMFYAASLQLIMFADFTGVDPDGITSTAISPLSQWTWIGMTWNFNTPLERPVYGAKTGDVFQDWSGPARVGYSTPTGVPVGPNNGDGYNVRIGNNNRFDGCFHGYIAETYVWRRILTIEQMKLVATNGPGAHLQDIHFWYNPNEDPPPLPGTNFKQTPDRSGNGRTGIIIGNPTFTAFEPRPSLKPGGKFGPQVVV